MRINPPEFIEIARVESTNDIESLASLGDNTDIFESLQNDTYKSRHRRRRRSSLICSGQRTHDKTTKSSFNERRRKEQDSETQIMKQKSMQSLDETTLLDYKIRGSSAKFNHASSADASFLTDTTKLQQEIIRLKMEMAQLQADLDTQESVNQKVCRENATMKSLLSETIAERDCFKEFVERTQKEDDKECCSIKSNSDDRNCKSEVIPRKPMRFIFRRMSLV